MGCCSSKPAEEVAINNEQKQNKSVPVESPPVSVTNEPKVETEDLTTNVVEEVPEPVEQDPPIEEDRITESRVVRSISDIYTLGETLGEGAFSVVRAATEKETGNTFAVKQITKSHLSAEDRAALRDEITILKLMDQPHIIRLYGVFDDANYYYLATERMNGGELFDRIVSKTFYNEKEARDLCKTLFEVVDYLQRHRIAHRDLKPENLLLINRTDDSSIKLADFGFAKKCPDEYSLRTQCGTPGYVAPEVLEGIPYGCQSDMWSIGVISYILLGGYPPFLEVKENQRELFRKIRKGQYKFHEEYWGEVSKEAKDLIASLLITDPKKRLKPSDALQHPWIKFDDSYLEGKDLGVNLAELKKFNAKRKFRAAVKAVVIVSKFQSLGSNLQDNLD